MIKTFNKYAGKLNNPSLPSIADQTIEEYLGTFEKKMMVFESYWNDNVFDNQSIKPFIKNIGSLVCDEIKVAHRYFDSEQGLSSYIEYPSGKIWVDPQTFGTSIVYFATHGVKAGLNVPLQIIGKEDLIKACKGFALFPNILFFSGCGVFGGREGKQFGEELVKTSGTRAVLGFTNEELRFDTGTIVDLLFLTRFFSFTEDDPFKNLQKIYDSVIHDFKPASLGGFTLFLNEDFSDISY